MPLANIYFSKEEDNQISFQASIWGCSKQDAVKRIVRQFRQTGKNYTCYKCNHTWVTKTEEYPSRCPQCKTYPWWINYNLPCDLCGNICYRLEEHHIDGNRKNSHLGNRIKVCKRCHQSIHKGYIPNHIKDGELILNFKRILCLFRDSINKEARKQ